MRSVSRVPKYWIGALKDHEYRCSSFAEALIPWSAETFSRSGYVYGPTGSGKTVALHQFVAIDLQENHSIVVFDPFQDFGDGVLELCARLGKPSSLIKLFDFGELVHGQGFDPCSRSSQPPSQTALGVLSAISSKWEGLGPQTTETLLNALNLLCEVGGRLTDIEDLLYSRRVRSTLIARCKESRVRDFWIRYDELSSDKQAVLASPIVNKLASLLSVESLRRMFGHQYPLDLARHLNTPGSVTIVNMRASEFHSASWQAGALILGAIRDEIFSRGTIPESQRNPVRIYCDEFAGFDMTGFESILASGRRYKCSLVLAHQNLNQIDAKMRATVLGNVGVKLIFGASHADSQIINRDIAGDAKAFDLAALPVGEAILWQRGSAPMHIEVNAPLIKDVGRKSNATRLLIGELKRFSPREESDVQRGRISDLSTDFDSKADREAERKDDADAGPDLEGWL